MSKFNWHQDKKDYLIDQNETTSKKVKVVLCIIVLLCLPIIGALVQEYVL